MQYVAFLRGINVGGRIIKKDDLKAGLEKLGLDDVKTVLQSGNVLFSSDKTAEELKDIIEAGLTKTFNYPAKVWVLTLDEIHDIIAANPFADAPPDYHQYVILFEDGLEKDFVAETAGLKSEAVKLGNGVAYWKVQKGMTLQSSRGKLMSKTKYREHNTNRNIKTLQRLV